MAITNKMGESLQLLEDGKKCFGFAGRDYLVDEVMGPIFCGKTLPGGLTARFMTPKPANMLILTNFTARQCRLIQRTVNPIMTGSSASERVAGLRALAADSRFEAFSDLLAQKIEAQRYRYASVAQLRRDLQRQLHQEPVESHAGILNHVAFSLIDQRPPRFIHFADELLDRSLALAENLFNTDSKAWTLHLLGREAEALGWMNRSLAHFGPACTYSERSALQSALAHRGVILWSLDRKPEALEDWAQASLLDNAGGWVNDLPDWSTLEAAVKARAEQLQADHATTHLCGTTSDEGVPSSGSGHDADRGLMDHGRNEKEPG
jgi:hypothetical protein